MAVFAASFVDDFLSGTFRVAEIKGGHSEAGAPREGQSKPEWQGGAARPSSTPHPRTTTRRDESICGCCCCCCSACQQATCITSDFILLTHEERCAAQRRGAPAPAREPAGACEPRWTVGFASAGLDKDAKPKPSKGTGASSFQPFVFLPSSPHLPIIITQS